MIWRQEMQRDGQKCNDLETRNAKRMIQLENNVNDHHNNSNNDNNNNKFP